MRKLQPNHETGFLESSNKTITEHRNIFDSSKKLQLLKLAKEYIEERDCYPPIGALCKTVGVSIQVFEVHLKLDPAFKNAWNEVVSMLKSIYTSKLATKADSKNGIVANLAILKYLETGSFVDRLQVNSIDNTLVDKRINSAFNDAIDAEIVDNQVITSTPPVDQKVTDTQPE